MMLRGAFRRVRGNNPTTFDSLVVEKLPLAPTDASVIDMAEGVGFSQTWTAVAKAARRPKAAPPVSGNIVQVMGIAKAPPLVGPPVAPAAASAAAPAASAAPTPMMAAPPPMIAPIPAAPVPPPAAPSTAVAAGGVGAGGDEVVCVICMDAIGEDEGAHTLPCNHKLHAVCFNQWRTTATNIAHPDHCPMGCHRSAQAATLPDLANAAVDDAWEAVETENMGS